MSNKLPTQRTPIGSVLRKGRVLYVDPNETYRQSIATALMPDANSGKKSVVLEYAKTRADAVKRIVGNGSGATKPEPFDLIICEYDLLDGHTAQEFLDDIREGCLVPSYTVFIMVTRENTKQKVIALLKYHPDDYLLKVDKNKGVIRPEEIEFRAVKSIQGRNELMSIHLEFEKKEKDPSNARKYYEKALALCNQYLGDQSPLTTEKKRGLWGKLMNIKGSIQNALRNYEDAEKTYQEIINTEAAAEAAAKSAAKEGKEPKPRPPSCAHSGLAKSLHHQGKTEAAKDILIALVQDNPYYLEGYNALAEIFHGSGQDDQAQQFLEKAVEISPESYGDQEFLAMVAFDNGDFKVSEAAFSQLVNKGKMTKWNRPDHYAQMAAIKMDSGTPEGLDEALALLRQGSALFKGGELRNEAALTEATMKHTIYKKKAEMSEALREADPAAFTSRRHAADVIRSTEESNKAIEDAVRLYSDSGTDFSKLGEPMRLRFACTCLEAGKTDVAENALGKIVQDSPNKGRAQKRAEKMMGGSPQAAEMFRTFKAKIEESLGRTLKDILDVSRSGKVEDRKQAITRIDILLRESPHNPEILEKAAQMYFTSAKLDRSVQAYDSARNYLHRLVQIDPTYPNIWMVEKFSEDALKVIKPLIGTIQAEVTNGPLEGIPVEKPEGDDFLPPEFRL